VVSFDGVTEERVAELRQRMASEPRPTTTAPPTGR
jgi:hypothetical protein